MSDAVLLTPGAGMEGRRTVRHSHVGQKGDLTVELHYGDFGTGHGRQAALCIYRRGHEKDGVFVPLSMMWQFAEREALHQMIPPMAERVYGFVTQQDQFRLLDAIMDYLGDLRKSPPDPDLYKDRSLAAFMQSCADEGLDFEVRQGGRHGTRILSTH